MQITINTADILGDETTIREEVIAQVSHALLSEMRKNADTIVKETLEAALVQTAKEQVQLLVESHLDTEFTETTSYGKVVKTSTFRNRIADILEAQCVFKQGHYSSDQNAFTKAVMSTVELEMSKFKKEYISLVNQKLITESLDMAAKKLREACGIITK